MKVFKFGGASVKDADAVRNVAEIIKNFPSENIIAIVSAMGKTTNALEDITNAHYRKEGNANELLDNLKAFHKEILSDLFPDATKSIYEEVNNLFVEIEWQLSDEPEKSYSYIYDQIVSMGEMFSTRILSAYMNEIGVKNDWRDVRDFVKTDATYREAKVDFNLSQDAVNKSLKPKYDGKDVVVTVTQGFIGVTDENCTTTLGREGSDYTGAILANLTDAESLTIWKDVPGMLNADPKYFDDTILMEHISYNEAIELSYYGASIIHPNTMKPLQNKHIPLLIRSFISPEKIGTRIDDNMDDDSKISSFIFKMNQELISISPKDLSFVLEDHMANIFSIFSKNFIRVNLMQSSALKFQACINYDAHKIPLLLADLAEEYDVKEYQNLELVTIRHFDQSTIDRVKVNKEVLMKQMSQKTHTVRMLMYDKNNI
ncbi:MAG: aspartate kinase [Flavobacteriales bacterium]|nr:aspartate kinase [Flavobacteriales bacterium]